MFVTSHWNDWNILYANVRDKICQKVALLIFNIINALNAPKDELSECNSLVNYKNYIYVLIKSIPKMFGLTNRRIDGSI